MKIQSKEDVDVVNKRFNGFHDGFFKHIQVTSDNKFVYMRGYSEPFKTNEEALRATGMCASDWKCIELTIHHFNYDWPNQPRTRAIHVRADNITNIADSLLAFIGREIFDLSFMAEETGISCILTFHNNDAGAYRSTENGIKKVLFSAKVIEVEETTWAEATTSIWEARFQ